ncbi:MAG TPA: hypothetical protein VIS06_01945 [Mycobacteriales bacterium]
MTYRHRSSSVRHGRPPRDAARPRFDPRSEPRIDPDDDDPTGPMGPTDPTSPTNPTDPGDLTGPDAAGPLTPDTWPEVIRCARPLDADPAGPAGWTSTGRWA